MADEHVLGSLRLLLIAGIDTTWSAIGSSLWHLAKTPADRERLVAEPELMPTAVEELLRAYSPVTMAREVMKETTISGCPVKPGNMVLLSFPAANRDPAMFPDADKVVIDRKENRHAAFGLGIHRCVGSNLARMEMTVAIEEWLKRIPDFRLDPAGKVTWSEGTVRGPRQLPVLFGKATLIRKAGIANPPWRVGHDGSSHQTRGRSTRHRGRRTPDQGDLHRLDRQSRRMVRFLRLYRVRAVLRAGVLPAQRSGGAAAQRGRAVRGDLPDAAARRLAVRLHRRPLRPTAVADAVGGLHVLRLADHRGDADLCHDRHRRAGHSGAGAHHRGLEPRRRIRRQRHLSQRGRRSQASRLLFELPVRHADRRPAHRDHRAVAAAEGVPDAGGTEGLGLADSRS